MICVDSIVIPAYNEEKRITKTLKAYTDHFKGNNYEIIVVCDGCTDKTAEIVKIFSKRNSRVRLLEHGKRLGKGGGVYYGFSKCKGNTIGFSDADNAISPKEYAKLLRELENTDAVIASRRKKNSVTIVPQTKAWVLAMRFSSRVYNLLVNMMFRINIRDTQCGAKIMKRYVYNSIRKELRLTGFEFDVELIWRIKKHGYRVREVGITWVHNLDSKSSIKNSYRMFKSLFNRWREG